MAILLLDFKNDIKVWTLWAKAVNLLSSAKSLKKQLKRMGSTKEPRGAPKITLLNSLNIWFMQIQFNSRDRNVCQISSYHK